MVANQNAATVVSVKSSEVEVIWDPGQDNSLVSRDAYMIMQGAQCMCVCVWGRVVAVVTGPDLGEEEVQSRRVHLDEEGCMDGG